LRLDMSGAPYGVRVFRLFGGLENVYADRAALDVTAAKNVGGFRYGDLLLAAAECAAWRALLPSSSGRGLGVRGLPKPAATSSDAPALVADVRLHRARLFRA